MSAALIVAIVGAVLFPLYLLLWALCKAAARGDEHVLREPQDEEPDTRPWNDRGHWS